MKKKLLLLAVFLIVGTLSSQTLNQTTTWPNASWTLTGTYNSGNLLLNPTTIDSNFKFDDNQVANTGDIIYLQSPLIDLSAAFSAGEKALKISFNLSYALTPATSELIGIEYWDADAGAWTSMPNTSAASGSSVGTYTSCTGVLDDEYFDFSAFTLNQQQNFKYRFFYNDGGLSKGKGACIAAPTVISFSCNAPSSLQVQQIFTDHVVIGWTGNGGSNWEIEYGLQGFALGTGTVQFTNITSATVNGLTQNTSYDIYVRADCSGGNQDFYSNYSNKVNFSTTSTLGISNQKIEGFGFYPNPTKDNMTLKANQNIDKIEVYNLLGQQIMIVQPKVSAYQLNVSNLKTGIYFMKVKVADKIGAYKIVIQ